MNETQFARAACRFLDGGLQRLDATTVERLALARRQAVGRQRQAVALPAAVGNHLFHRGDHARLYSAIAGVAFVAVIGIYAYWQIETLIDDLSTVDSALLADDMPVDALVDKGFEAWLANSR